MHGEEVEVRGEMISDKNRKREGLDISR